MRTETRRSLLTGDARLGHKNSPDAAVGDGHVGLTVDISQLIQRAHQIQIALQLGRRHSVFIVFIIIEAVRSNGIMTAL